MRRAVLALLLALAVLAGCSKGTPKAVTNATEHDYGDVPVTDDMSKALLKEFVIMNDGTKDLKLSNVQIQTLEGC